MMGIMSKKDSYAILSHWDLGIIPKAWLNLPDWYLMEDFWGKGGKKGHLSSLEGKLGANLLTNNGSKSYSGWTEWYGTLKELQIL
jgi:hypothetical protein